MSLMADLVRRSLGDLTTETKQKLIRELENIGKDFLVPHVADTMSRTCLKSLDGVVAAAVKALPQEEAERLAADYLSEIQDQVEQFSEALFDYLPFAVAVEQAKKEHGKDSAVANAARRARQSYIDRVRSEVRDIFRAVAGQTVTD